jgi:hypothetical protein
VPMFRVSKPEAATMCCSNVLNDLHNNLHQRQEGNLLFRFNEHAHLSSVSYFSFVVKCFNSDFRGLHCLI